MHSHQRDAVSEDEITRKVQERERWTIRKAVNMQLSQLIDEY